MPQKIATGKKNADSFIFTFKASSMHVSGRPIFCLSSKIRSMGATWNADGAPEPSWTFDLSANISNDYAQSIMDDLHSLYDEYKGKKALQLQKKLAIKLENQLENKPLQAIQVPVVEQAKSSDSKTSVFRKRIDVLSAQSAAVARAMCFCECQDDYFRLKFQLQQISVELYEAADYLENA